MNSDPNGDSPHSTTNDGDLTDPYSVSGSDGNGIESTSFENEARAPHKGDNPRVSRNCGTDPETETGFVEEEEDVSEDIPQTFPPVSTESSLEDSPLVEPSERSDVAPSSHESIRNAESQGSDDLHTHGTDRNSVNSVESLQMKNALLYKNLSEINSTDRFGFSLKDGFRHSLPKTSTDISNFFHFLSNPNAYN